MKVKTFYAALAVLAIALGSVTTAMADDITADVLTYDGKAKVVTAKGNVVIHANEGATITAADGEYHFEDRSAFLEGGDRKSTRLNSSHIEESRMPSSA